MSEFTKAYRMLNPAQKAAVDLIYGPLLVVAGPGTGKTQLISTRVANIIDKGAAEARDILCLTFTDAAARTLRARLIEMIGEEAYRVHIHTFHSLGLEILGRYPEVFSSTIGFRAIDDVSSYQLFEELLSDLPKKSPLATKGPDGRLVWLRAVREGISDLKKAGLTPSELEAILDGNSQFMDLVETRLNEAFTGVWRGKAVEKQMAAAESVLSYSKKQADPAQPVKTFETLKSVFERTLALALETPTALKQWRDDWLSGPDGKRQLAMRLEHEKLADLVKVYARYNDALRQAQLYDYNDMIIMVTDELRTNADFRAEIQERYQFILVDEFQDTNDSQLQLLTELSNNPSQEGKPNIMAVGDDDQAIYRFQGAEASNLLEFRDSFAATKLQVLKTNYRSTQDILDSAAHVIDFSANRLTHFVKEIDKKIAAHKAGDGEIELAGLPDKTSAYHYAAQKVKALIKQGVTPSEIAVIGRLHRDLIEMLPHLDMPVRYEKRDNVLDQPHIEQLITLSRAVVSLRRADFETLDSLIGEIISYGFWQVPVDEIWRFAATARRARNVSWFESLQEAKEPKLSQIATTLGELARAEPLETAETMLDKIIGNLPLSDKDKSLVSPYKEYYFSGQKYETERGEYLELLSGLSALRRAFREWRKAGQSGLSDFVHFIDAAQRAGLDIADRAPHRESEDAVNLLTAHSAKGAEFEAVIILNGVGEHWDSGKVGGLSIKWPKNLPITIGSDDENDRARLFYVAMTRAKKHLLIAAYGQLDSGRGTTPLRFASTREGKKPQQLELKETALEGEVALEERLTHDWRNRHFDRIAEGKAALKERLDTYQLSPTDLNAFIDVASGGPRRFLFDNLLKFPRAKTASQSFGTAIHGALSMAHQTGKPSLPKLLADFELVLSAEALSDKDFKRELRHGQSVLRPYWAEGLVEPSPKIKVELPFFSEGAMVGPARLTGRVDKLEILDGDWNKGGKLYVGDFKTGKPRASWGSLRSDIGLFKGRQQLLFYKLLIEGSRSYSKGFEVSEGGLEYVEAPLKKQPVRLSMSYQEDELAKMRKLIEAVWARIMALEFEDTSGYEPNVKGVQRFIEELIRG